MIRAYLAPVLIAYGALGVAINLRLLPLLAAGLSSWLGLPSWNTAPGQWPWLDPLQAHFDALPWLPWFAWLVGVGLLVRPLFSRPKPDALTVTTSSSVRTRWLVLGLLILLLLAGGYGRMNVLWPQSYGISQLPYDDEGVYAGASQLFTQGILPYRDYFFAHPPMAAISYAPAMLYHFTEWGSPTSFMMARYLSVFYSLVTLVLIFFLAYKLTGLWGGVLSAGLWALDGRVVEINRKVMLDGPMVLLSCAGLLLYLWVRPALSGDSERAPRRPLLILALAGVVATLSALTKIAGVACLLAIIVDLLWLGFDNRRRNSTALPLSRQLVALGAGTVVIALLIAGPFVLASPANFLRDVIFFQLLRPNDGLVDVPSRVENLSSTFSNSLTALFAALGFLLLSLRLWFAARSNSAEETTALSPWRAVALWTFFSVLLFTYSRSFYGHYYIQLAAPLCLLGAGVSCLPALAGRFVRAQRARRVALASAISIAAILLIALPLVVVEWNGLQARTENRIFEIVGRYVNDAVPPGSPVLSTDEQFNILAARPPSRNATGYLVDSYGHMIALGLGLQDRSWGDLIGSSLRGEHSNDVYSVIWRGAPQADMLNRALNVPLVVIHQEGATRLTPATLQGIQSHSQVAEQQFRYTIYRVTNPGSARK